MPHAFLRVFKRFYDVGDLTWSKTMSFFNTLAGNTLRSMAFRISLIVTCMSGMAYWHLMTTLEKAAKEQLGSLVEERGKRKNQKFILAEMNHQVMKTELT